MVWKDSKEIAQNKLEIKLLIKTIKVIIFRHLLHCLAIRLQGDNKNLYRTFITKGNR